MSACAASMSLADQQRALHAAMLGAPAGPGLLREPTQHEPLLRIYQNAYRARLIAALRDNHGVLPRAMGDEAFDALADAYLQAHPSRHPSIRWFGHRLAEFMAAHPALVPHPAFVDLARMEWALREAFDAADAVPMTPQELAALPADDWPRRVLRFHPSVQVLTLDWQVEPAWRALQGGGDDEVEPELAEPEAGEHQLIVWRPALETRWRSAVDAVEAQLLAAAMRGDDFSVLCVSAAEALGDEQAVVGVVGAIQRWTAEGLLVK
jgi:hypothetical protein